MNSRHPLAVSAFLLALSSFLPSALPAAEWQLVWSDEFNGASIDTAKWNHEVNGQGGGNNELQYYTARPENSYISNGRLVIKAIKESYTGPDGTRDYTSARMNTKFKGDWTYGRIEVRADLPTFQGLWPAIWMLPTNNVYGGWAASGEIDIMEYRGDQPTTLYTTIHHGGQWPANTHTGIQTAVPPLADAMHEYALEWEPNEIRWYLDGNEIYSLNSWTSAGGPYPAPFNQAFHLLLNVAVGGNFLTNPDPGATYFPQQMDVEYVRVYQAVASPPTQSPLTTPHQIPGVIPAAGFDIGGQNVAYHDTTPANIPNLARTSEAVDLENAGDGTFSIGNFEPGEWVEYSATATLEDTYTVVARVASLSTGGLLTVRSTPAAGDVTAVFDSFPSTGGWTTWQDATIGNLFLEAGATMLRVTCDTPQFNLHSLTIQPTPQQAWLGTPLEIPGKIPASHYDVGGEGVAYHDTTPANQGTAYRTGESVDLGTSGDTDGGFSIGWFDVGEWVEYKVDVVQSNTFEVIARTAAAGQVGHLRLTFIDSDFNITEIETDTPNTGGWTTWVDHPVGDVTLPTGQYTMRVSLESGTTNLNYLQFNSLASGLAESWMILGQ